MALERANIPTNTVKIHAVRHAPPAVTGVCYGRREIAVTLSVSEAAARLLPQLPASLERVYTSPSQRAATVGASVAERLGLPLTVCPELFELDFGDWEGKPWTIIHDEQPEALASWAAHPLHTAPPGGETACALAARIWDWVAQYPLSGSLVVCHAGPIRVLRALEESRPSHRSQFLSDLGLDFTRDVPHLVLETLLLPEVRSVRPRTFQR